VGAKLNPIDYTNLMWAASVLEVPLHGTALASMVRQALATSLRGWRTKELCALIWAFALLKLSPGAEPLAAMLDRVAVHLRALPLKHTVSALAGAALLNHKPPRSLLEHLEHELADSVLQVRTIQPHACVCMCVRRRGATANALRCCRRTAGTSHAACTRLRGLRMSPVCCWRGWTRGCRTPRVRSQGAHTAPSRCCGASQRLTRRSRGCMHGRCSYSPISTRASWGAACSTRLSWHTILASSKGALHAEGSSAPRLRFCDLSVAASTAEPPACGQR
jgi:hypothetical protein